MNTSVQKLPFDANFEANLRALCTQQAVQQRKLITSFVAPNSTTIVLIFG
jgi:hypothetical protein